MSEIEDKKPVNLQVKTMRPIGDHVLVTPIPEDDEIVAPGGTKFVLADSAKDKPNRGIVVAVGDGRILPSGDLRAIALVKGEKVLFSKYAGNEFTVNGERYIILSYDDILIVLE